MLTHEALRDVEAKQIVMRGSKPNFQKDPDQKVKDVGSCETRQPSDTRFYTRL